MEMIERDYEKRLWDANSAAYAFSMTTFDPKGKLLQGEYALKRVDKGELAVGIKVRSGVIIACEKKRRLRLMELDSINKVFTIAPNIGMAFSGYDPDYRLIYKSARKASQQYLTEYAKEPFLPPKERPEQSTVSVASKYLIGQVRDLYQKFTLSEGVRPLGASVLMASWDKTENEADRPLEPEKPSGRASLYRCDPDGSCGQHKVIAIGKHSSDVRDFIQKRYNFEEGLDEVFLTALRALKHRYEGTMTAENVEVGRCDHRGFYQYTPQELFGAVERIGNN